MTDPPHPHSTDVSLVFPPDPAWVRTARDTVRTLLTTTGHPELTDTAVLLTSEAVTNAINACATQVCTAPVTLFAGWAGPHPDGARLRVLVHDEALGLPVCEPAADDDETGRGMRLVAHSADAWGVCRHGPGQGKATWFELEVRALEVRAPAAPG
ncbi:ATP-binding protein [Streptomyces sp. NPDC059009]|uniref:ATP-binding protein n=1 Tax=Streptomyces sp. NPDC059009 TaxID=3346694 RepID=UPI0036907443